MKDALTTILDTIKDEDQKKIDDLFVSTMRHVHHERKYVTSRPLFESPYSDNMQCLTSFHPIADPNANLEKILIKNNLTPELQAFKKIIFEDLLEKGIATRARERGYKDYKYMFYGNNQSIPLSMKITINQVGVSFICQPPGVWGRYPSGFKSMWENATEIYLTKNVGVEKYDRLYIDGALNIGNTNNNNNNNNNNDNNNNNSTNTDSNNSINNSTNSSSNSTDSNSNNNSTSSTSSSNNNNNNNAENSINTFKFSKDTATLIPIKADKPGDSQFVCASFTEKFPIGTHILTVFPTTGDNIMVATLLLP